MPEKIFISSTSEDLKSHRDLVRSVITSLEQVVVGMEDWGASPHPPLDFCYKKISTSSIVICIIGTRYGYKDQHNKSYTQLEYEYAEKYNKHILVYVIDESTHLVRPTDVDTGEDATRLVGFKSIISNRLYKKFSSAEHLARIVASDIIFYLNEIGENIKLSQDEYISSTVNMPFGYMHGDVLKFFNINEHVSLDESFVFRQDSTINETIAGCILISQLENNNYGVLDGLTSFHPVSFQSLLHYLPKSNIDKLVLSKEILNSTDSFKLRLLVIIAGILRAQECASAICTQVLLFGQHHTDVLKSEQTPMTPFYDVASEALSGMGNDIVDILDIYTGKAKLKKSWHAKKTFEKTLRLLRRKT